MNRSPLLYVGGVLAALAFAVGYAAGSSGLQGVPGMTPIAATAEDGISCYFSPKGGCTEAVVQEINNAQHEIMMQAYSFTSDPIAEALVDAHHRGVKITVVLDKSQREEPSRAAEDVEHDKIPTLIDAQHAIAHNKIILIDGRTIITGSFNFTHQAETSNAENLLILHDKPKLYAAYQQNFELHLGHSDPVDPSREPVRSASKSQRSDRSRRSEARP